MQGVERYSLDELIDLAVEDRLIEAYWVFDDHIEISLGETRLSLPYLHARTFLIGMLRGRSWHVGPPAPPSRRPAHTPEPLAADRLSAATLDDLLAYANLLELIEDYQRSPSGDAVLLRLWACSCPLSAADARAFLSDIIREELHRRQDVADEAAAHDLLAASRAPIDPATHRANLLEQAPADRAPWRA